jgi:hypothetical protein
MGEFRLRFLPQLMMKKRSEEAFALQIPRVVQARRGQALFLLPRA